GSNNTPGDGTGGSMANAGNGGNTQVEPPHTPDAGTNPGPHNLIPPSDPPVRRNHTRPDSHNDTAAASSAKDRPYTIKSGDTLSSIATEIYGNPRYWVAIQRENKTINSNHLKIGEKIQLPDPSIVRPTEVVADGGMAVEPPAGTARTAVVVDQPPD